MPDSFEAQVRQGDGLAAVGARVRIRPVHWTIDEGTPSQTWETSTDASGRFGLALPDSGRWTLEILDTSCGEGRFLSTSFDSLRRIDGTTVQLAPLASIRGILPVGEGLVVLEGTDLWTRPDSLGRWSFRGLGTGTYRPVWIVSGSDSSLGPVEVPPGDTTILSGSSATPGIVAAGRLVPATGWSSTPTSVEGWVVEAVGSTVRDTTDALGSFRLAGLPPGVLAIVATDPATGATARWDTSVATPNARLDLPERLALPAGDTASYAILQVANPDRIRHRLRVRALPDTSALNATGAGDAARAALPAMTGWTDESGRFALQRDGSRAYHVVLEDSVTGLGAVFAWGAGHPDSLASIRIGSAAPGLVTIRFPDGTPPGSWLQGHLVSAMGTTRVSLPVLPGNPASLPGLYPGDYRLAVVSYETAQDIPSTLEFRVVEGSPLVLDTLLTQDQVEDTSSWRHATRVEIDPGTLSSTLRHVPVRIDLDLALVSDSEAVESSGNDLRIFDERGRWIPGVLTRFDRAAKVARAWILLDSLAPGQPRLLLVRHGNPLAGRGGFGAKARVFSAPTGILATFRGDTQDATGLGLRVDAAGATYVPGFLSPLSLALGVGGSLRTELPVSELGTAFGVQAVVRLDGAAGETERILSLRDPASSVPFASIGTRAGKPVFFAMGTDSVVVESPLGLDDLPRGSLLVVQVRRLGDSVDIAIRTPDGRARAHLATSLVWPSRNDSLGVLLGSPATELSGFPGGVEVFEILDGSWTEDRAVFDATQWDTTPARVRATVVR